jgi:hypothetical protein
MRCTITVYNSDPNYNSVIDFISEKLMSESNDTNASAMNNSLQANTKLKKKGRKEYINEYFGVRSKEPPKFEFRPDADHAIHKLRYKGRDVYLERIKTSQPLMGKDKPFVPENIILTVWSWNKVDGGLLLKDLLNEAIQYGFETKSDLGYKKYVSIYIIFIYALKYIILCIHINYVFVY